MSWGSAETAGETFYDGVFKTPAGHIGVTFLAATGDYSAPGDYPAASPYVLAVGGTQFTSPLDAQGEYTGEKAWGSGVAGSSGSGGGVSPYESQPAYQRGVVTQSATARAFPDVAFDSNSGVAVYDSADNPWNPWVDIGGTSLATPCWAAVVAIADQGLVALGGGTLGDQSAMTMLYALQAKAGANSFHDIVTGSNGYPAGPGFDLVTGLGTPMAPAIAEGLSGNTVAPLTAGPSGAVYNTAPTFQWSAVAGAQSYHLVAYDQITSAKALDVVVATTSYKPGAAVFNPGRSYWWKVEAWAGLWSTGTPSAALGFNLPAGTLPVPGSPTSGAALSTTSPTLTWSSVSGAQFYGVTLYDQANPTTPVLKQVQVNGTSYTPSTPLLAGHAYSWSIQAYFGQGGVGYFGPASQSSSFVVTPLAAPPLIAPAAGSSTSNTAPTFQWSTVPGAVSYALVVTDLTASTTAISASELTSTSYATTTPLVAGHRYQWTVTATDAVGDPGVSANPVGLTIVVPPPVVAPPTAASPSGTVSSAQPSLRWSTVAGASGYGVEIVDKTPGARTSAFPLANVSGTTYTPGSPLQAGHTYIWQVIAYGVGQLQRLERPLTFTVKDEATDDFDGLGRSELAVSTPTAGFQTVVNPVTGAVHSVYYGAAGVPTFPVPGDYDGIGRTEIASFVPSTGVWTVWNPITNTARSFVFGGPGMVPIPGDYDGIGRTEPAIYTVSTATWTIFNPLTGNSRNITWGVPNYWDVPTPGDFDGVGRTELAAFIPATATWVIWNPVTNGVRTINYGSPNNINIPAPGDYDGIGFTEIAVFVPSSATWAIWNPVTNTQRFLVAGAPNLHDVPLETPSATVASLGLIHAPTTPTGVTPSVTVSVPSGPALVAPSSSRTNPTPPSPSAVVGINAVVSAGRPSASRCRSRRHSLS